MFILRRISADGVEMNHAVGENYTYIHRTFNPLDFQATFKLYFEKNHVADLDPSSDDDTTQVYAFICNGKFLQPLYKRQKNFMMTDSGNTFANLTDK